MSRESGRRRGLALFLSVAVAGSAALVVAIGLSLANAVELTSQAGQSLDSLRENVLDESISLGRVIFAAHRVVSFEASPGETPSEILERRLSASEGLLSHARIVKRTDRAFIDSLISSDPLMLRERSAASDAEYQGALGRLEALAARARASTDPAARRAALDEFAAGAEALMPVLEKRTSILLQIEDYFYVVTKRNLSDLLGHGGTLIAVISLMVLVLGAAVAVYLRSLARTRRELELHREHLGDLVGQRTAELSGANERLRAEIAERERVEDRLRATIGERETLIREVNHRTKNNLALVNSLIGIQSSGASAEAGAVFTDLQNRIASISLIHEKLYRGADLANIGVEEYLDDFLRGLVAALREDPSSVRIEVRARDIRVGPDFLVPFGLITNEIATNSLKHGFRRRARGLISVEGRREGQDLLFDLGDDGEPPERPEALLESRSMGALLVRDLCKQLKGGFTVDFDGGTHYHFVFAGRGGQGF